MTDSTTRSMQDAYIKGAARPVNFLSGFFTSGSAHFHNTEKVELDVYRSDEEIAVVIQDMSQGYRMNAESKFTNKEFTPPVFKEAVPLNAFDLLKRNPGQNPFEDPEYRGNLTARAYSAISKVENKIRRSIEVQASQVLQTGQITLRDSNGTALYTLDFKPKTSHFVSAGVSWATATAEQKLGDIDAVGEEIRDDGLGDPNQLIMGTDAFENLFGDEDVRPRFDIRNYNQGRIVSMEVRGNGGTYRGIIEIGNYKYDVWTYGGRYIDPQTRQKVRFVDPGNVIVRVADARLNTSFGAIPNIGKLLGASNQNLLPELPGRLSNAGGSMDLFTNTWISGDGEQMFVGVGARPLLQPTDIDSFGCITTGL